MKWSPAHINDIRARRSQGETWPDIAASYGVKPQAVRKAFEYYGGHVTPEFPDWQVPEQVDWREWFGSWDESLQLHKRADPRQSQYTIDLKADHPVTIVSASDLHMGGGWTDHEAIRETIELIINTPGMYVGVAGDSIEGFLPGLKPAETIEQQPASIRSQLFALESLVDELTGAGKLLYLTWGDHDAKWFEQSIGVNLVKLMHDRKVIYLNARGLISLNVGAQTYYLLVNHSERFSSQYSKTHPQRRAYDQFFPADVIIGGHRHQPEYRVFWHYQQLREVGIDLGGKCILIANGTFKTGPDAYSCRSWQEGVIGCPTLVFNNEAHDVEVFEGPIKAATYMRGLG